MKNATKTEGGRVYAQGSQIVCIEFWFGGTGHLKFRANIAPRWIRNARTSRKRVEPEIVSSLRTLKQLRKNRPRARIAIEHAGKGLRDVLNRWEIAYCKENFYRGIRILLELQRNGSSNL